VVVCSDLGSRLPLGGGACSMEALRSLAKVRVKVDQVLFFWVGLKDQCIEGYKEKDGPGSFFLGWA
jgi:hypothetical protein